MPRFRTDPDAELRSRVSQMARAQQTGQMDRRELSERTEAAEAYSLENEKHFVDYAMDCINTSMTATDNIRKTWALLWSMFNEDEPEVFNRKAPWQSRVVLPKPFGAVIHGSSAIKKAFSPDFLSVTDNLDKEAGNFWRQVMSTQLNDSHANFPIKFTDATTMAMAIGLSLEMIPQWIPGKGLSFSLAEPWKIHRDPDAPPRDPQGGLYWIHTEWLDYHVLLRGQKNGKYAKVALAKDVQNQYTEDPFTTQEALAKRKKMVWQRSTFRAMLQTHEFWGVILGPDGNVLIPSATMTISGGRLIERPKKVAFSWMRWPGICFSPLPDILSFNGRGLLRGVHRLWDSMNTLACLHEDAVKWLVNPSKEVNIDLLDDPTDTRDIPGKSFLTRDSVHGNQAIRNTQRRDATNSSLALLQYFDQNFEAGSFTPHFLSGLPGYRKEITARESMLKSSQAQGPFTLMGGNLEHGAKLAIRAGQDMVQTLAGFNDYAAMLPPDELIKHGIDIDPVSGQLVGVPQMSGSFSVSGISAMMKDAEVLDYLIHTVIPLSQQPRFAPFWRPYKISKALEKRTKLTEEDLLIEDEAAEAIEKGEQAQYAQGVHIQGQSQQMAFQQQIMDLMERLDAYINQGGEGPNAK